MIVSDIQLFALWMIFILLYLLRNLLWVFNTGAVISETPSTVDVSVLKILLHLILAVGVMLPKPIRPWLKTTLTGFF